MDINNFSGNLSLVLPKGQELTYDAIEIVKSQIGAKYLDGLIWLVMVNMAWLSFSLGCSPFMDKYFEQLGFKKGYFYGIVLGVSLAFNVFVLVYLYAIR